MLTKTDIEQLKTVFATKEDIRGIVRIEVEDVVAKKLKPIKKDLKYLRKTVSIIVKNYDEADVKLARRVTRIEQHLGL